jgi:hypothetical protein
VCAYLQKFPSPSCETHACSLLAGRRCLYRGWHGDLFIVHQGKLL